MIAAALLAAPPSSSSLSSSLSSSSTKPTFTVTTTTSSTAMKTTEQQVRTLIPVTTADGSKLFVSGPCIVLKTQTPTTVAQQMQALRPLLKSDTNSNNNNSNVISKTGLKKKANSDVTSSNSSSSSNPGSRAGSTSSDVQLKSPGGSDAENEPEALRCKRRIDFATLGLPRPQPAAMARRNERERNRVKQVNMGFETLRQHVPQGRKNKKLSKVDTLKEAAKYIKQLHQLLLDADEDCDESVTSAVFDTITIVSRPSHSTTVSAAATNSKAASEASSATVVASSSSSSSLSSLSSSPLPAETSSTTTVTTESAATNTATITEADLLQFAASASAFSCEDNNHLHQQHRSGMNQMVSEPVHFQPSNADCVALDVDSNGLMETGLSNPDVDFEAVAHQLTSNVHEFVGSVSPPMAVGNLVIGSSSPSQFVELAPAQLDFGSQQCSPRHHSPVHSTPTITPSTAGITSTTSNPTAMEVDQVNVAFDVPSNFLLASLGASNLSSNPLQHPTHHFVDFHHHHHVHHDSSNSRVTSSSSSSTPTTPISESSSPPTDPSPAEVASVVGFQYPRKNQRGCGGSEGSCPVSPSESSGSSSEVSHEDCLGMYGGETWQDLSADIAEWLCSKIDIDDPDVFV